MAMEETPVWKLLIRLSAPVMLALLIQSIYNIVDSYFVARYSAEGLAALSIIFPIQLLMTALATGTGAGINILISRIDGAGDTKSQKDIISTGFFLGIMGALIFAAAGTPGIRIYYQISSEQELVREYGIQYAQIIFALSLGMFVEAAGTKMLQAKSDMVLPMCAQVAGAVLNIVLDPFLIFGYCGFPELGVEGAAISTAFSRGVSMVILFVILFRKHIHRFPLAYFRPFPWMELKNLMKVGLPSAGEQLSYSSSQVVITYFINMLVESLATRTYCVNIIMFAYLFSISMAQGGAICIGHLIGEKKPRAAFLMGKYVMKKSVMITLILSCILALLGHVIFGWLTSNPEIIKMGVTILIIDVVLEIGRPINIFATNALRAAGDVNYPFYVGLVVMWSVAVGLGYLFGIPFGWGICGMWIAFLLDENIRGAIFVRRWYSMKWVSKSFIK